MKSLEIEKTMMGEELERVVIELEKVKMERGYLRGALCGRG
jgi:hypothetical protein